MVFNHRKEHKEHKEVPEEKVVEINAQMEGSLVFTDPVNLKIHGRYTGKLDTRGTLTIGPTAQVEANIVGDSVIIAGKVKGNCTAKKVLVLMPTAVLHGEISTPKLNIVEGAIFQGHCHMLEGLLTLDDLAQYLEIDIPAILELATTGKIPAVKEGDNWKFDRSQIDAWAASGKVKL